MLQTFASGSLTLAKQGDIEAQCLTGQMYRKGLGVRENDNSASKWHRLAAEQGNIQAQMRLGLMYESGMGIRSDHTEAMKLYRKSAEQSFATAQLYFGAIYSHGAGVGKDEIEAVKWYPKPPTRISPRLNSIWARCMQKGEACNKALLLPPTGFIKRDWVISKKAKKMMRFVVLNV